MAHVHPRACYLFERQSLVNLILWSNFARLPNLALDALGASWGRPHAADSAYTATLLHGCLRDSRQDVIDVLPIQLQARADLMTM